MNEEQGPLDPKQAAQDRIVELFGAVCESPDDAGIAAAADQALRDLDALLVTG